MIDLERIYAFLKVTNFDDAVRSIAGLRERVKFTEDYETLKLRRAIPEPMRYRLTDSGVMQPDAMGSWIHVDDWPT